MKQKPRHAGAFCLQEVGALLVIPAKAGIHSLGAKE
jgi:hypothetical protein